MSQTAQDHTLIIRIQLNDTGNSLRYEVDQVTMLEGKSPGNGNPAAKNQFNCFHCKTNYFILPEFTWKFEVVSSANPQAHIKKEPELDLYESESLDEASSDDDGDILQDEMPPVLLVKNEEEVQESETVAKKNHIQPLGPDLDLNPFVRLVQNDAQLKDIADIGRNNQQHQKKEDSKDTKKRLYECDICKASIKHRSSLAKHMNIHLGVRLTCNECKASFSKKSNLNHHNRRLHQREFRKCEVCKWRKTCTKFEYHSHLRRRHPKFHIKEHRSKVPNFNGVDFPCIYCEPQAIFKNFEELKEHLGVIHDRKFPCTQCPKAATTQDTMTDHIGSVHEKMTYSCPECNKVLLWKHTLQRHLRSHQKQGNKRKSTTLE